MTAPVPSEPRNASAIEGRPSTKLALFLDENPEFVFAWQTVKRVFLFGVIAASTVVIHWMADAAEHTMPPAVSLILRLVAYVILAGDVLWLLQFLLNEMFLNIQKMLEGRVRWIVGALVLIGIGATLSGPLKLLLISIVQAMAKVVLEQVS